MPLYFDMHGIEDYYTVPDLYLIIEHKRTGECVMKHYQASYEENRARLDKLAASKNYREQAEYHFEIGDMYYRGACFGVGTSSRDTFHDGVYCTRVVEARPAFGIQSLQTAADMGHAGAQFEYAVILEKNKDIDLAVIYFAKAALQDNQDAYEKLKTYAPGLLGRILVLKGLLIEMHLIKDNLFNLGNENNEFRDENNIDLTRIICIFKAMIDVYAYLVSKAQNDHEQMEKRNDFASILRIINDSKHDEIKPALMKHEEATKDKFLKVKYMKYFSGKQKYRDCRQACLAVIRTAQPGIIKDAFKAIYKVIDEDNQLRKPAAMDIMTAYEKAVKAPQPS